MAVISLNPMVDLVPKVTMGKLRGMEEEQATLQDMEQEQATDLNLKVMEEEATSINLQDMEEEATVDRLLLQDMEEDQATDLKIKVMEETSNQVDTVVPPVVPQVTMVPHQATPPNKIMAEAPTVAIQATRNKDTVKVKDMEEEAIIQDTEAGTVGQKKRKLKMVPQKSKRKLLMNHPEAWRKMPTLKLPLSRDETCSLVFVCCCLHSNIYVYFKRLRPL